MVRVKFIKSGLPHCLAYSVGEVGELPEKQASELELSGVVEILKEFNDLPADIPGRRQLIDNGFKTVDELKNILDFTIYPGIGKMLDQKIIEYLNPDGV